MKVNNEMSLKFLSLRENESFARISVASFCANLNLNIEQIDDIKTAVSEAVTNSIVHGYPNKIGEIEIKCKIYEKEIVIDVIDFGVGIDNLEEALKPFYTSIPEQEHSGMGFTVMEGFMDNMVVQSSKDKGTTIRLTKKMVK